MHLNKKYFFVLFAVLLFAACKNEKENPRTVISFNKEWKFFLGDNPDAEKIGFDDSSWRKLNLPHDWSIEGNFSKDNPSTTEGGALPTGIGWYRKSFHIEESVEPGKYYIDFDGVFCNSEVWLNGHYMGKRPFGYNTFRYDMTPYLNIGEKENVIAVKVDNSLQPASRWYTGSGIYRNVWLVSTNEVHIDQLGNIYYNSGN